MTKVIMPERIGDVEIVPHSLSTHVKCIGSRKYDRAIMIRFKHSHYTNPVENGHCDVILTQLQLIQLMVELKEQLEVLKKDNMQVTIHDVTPGSL